MEYGRKELETVRLLIKEYLLVCLTKDIFYDCFYISFLVEDEISVIMMGQWPKFANVRRKEEKTNDEITYVINGFGEFKCYMALKFGSLEMKCFLKLQDLTGRQSVTVKFLRISIFFSL